MCESRKCAACGRDLLTAVNHHPVPGFVAVIEFVQHAHGKSIFVCWHCAGEREGSAGEDLLEP